MQIKKFLLPAIVCANVFFANAQTQLSGITGKVKSSNGTAVPAATVRLQNSSYGAVSDENGNYSISNVKPGSYILSVTAIGFKARKKNIKVEAGPPQNADFSLEEDAHNMETVNVIGRTKAQEVNRQAFNVTAIDAKKLYNTTLDISGALDRVGGVRVRETGGVGSSFNLSINGFSGNRIRYFIDGIPMDNFGSSFQINNIPINIADRVEVYKGVVPMWLGSDALGGAINIVTSDYYRNYADISYAYGSFNTHRTVINAAATTKNGFTVQLNAFQNYSDNNYKVHVEAADINTGAYAPEAVLPRFHDTYHNETLIANVGLVDKSFADKLLLGMTMGKNYKEMQTGARMAVVYGGWHRRGSIMMPSLKYKKENLIKGLDLTINANYNLGYEQNIDTVSGRFDWYGGFRPIGSSGEQGRTMTRYRNNNGLATAMASYRLNENSSISLNNVYNTFNRKVNDKENPGNADNNRVKKLSKNVIGLGYSYDLKDRFSLTVFGKLLTQRSVISDNGGGQPGIDKIGYGAALSYHLKPDFQLKASYELANRLPESNDIFGDLENLIGNPNLRPENSHNLNAGFSYGFAWNKDHRFSVAANGIYRYASDYIMMSFAPNQNKNILENREAVKAWGGDAEIRYSYKGWLSAGATFTYQMIKNLEEYVNDNNGNRTSTLSPVYLDQVPNIPYLFGNADVSAALKNVWRKGNNLNIGYNLMYVHEFWLYWPSRGQRDVTSKFVVPAQLSHDINIVYSMAQGKYNIGLEARNITDERMYDNFSLQKPGRAFYLNLRYFFNNK
ncbi:TonB-dependent receptor [Pedobacter africanus]|uniref:Outer membrane receptor proteins, mostly Fe transport n=1 Tax=Pedobacter africanus TaxID=151894 RepID=A0A1W2CKC3_9SPHI|nr:TonB-dependent receptor [Pedobacter africanus]SMC85685.1 Outer membrane receptor proteins, mostly Fe transport [Pedobacter africanus]